MNPGGETAVAVEQDGAVLFVDEVNPAGVEINHLQGGLEYGLQERGQISRLVCGNYDFIEDFDLSVDL